MECLLQTQTRPDIKPSLKLYQDCLCRLSFGCLSMINSCCRVHLMKLAFRGRQLVRTYSGWWYLTAVGDSPTAVVVHENIALRDLETTLSCTDKKHLATSLKALLRCGQA